MLDDNRNLRPLKVVMETQNIVFDIFLLFSAHINYFLKMRCSAYIRTLCIQQKTSRIHYFFCKVEQLWVNWLKRSTNNIGLQKRLPDPSMKTLGMGAAEFQIQTIQHIPGFFFLKKYYAPRQSQISSFTKRKFRLIRHRCKRQQVPHRSGNPEQSDAGCPGDVSLTYRKIKFGR